MSDESDDDALTQGSSSAVEHILMQPFVQQPPEFLFLPGAALITFSPNEQRFITGHSAVLNQQLAGWRLVCPLRELQNILPVCLMTEITEPY